MSAEMIIAIAGLWKLLAVLALIVLPIVFRKPLIATFDRLTKFQLKRDKIELAAELGGADVKLVKKAEVAPLALPEQQPESKTITSASGADSTDKLTKPEAPEDHFKELLDAAFTARDLSEMEQAHKKLQESQTDEDKRLEYEALYYYLRYDAGDISALNKLQEMAETARASGYAHEALALCHEAADDLTRAGVNFELAAKSFEKRGEDGDELRRVRCVVKAAECLLKTDRSQDAFQRIMRELSAVNDPLALAGLYEGLASLYEQADEVELRALALEKALEHKSNDVSLRFKAGFAYGQNDTHDVSLAHYRTLLQFNDKHAAALNNIAVQYQRLKMLLGSTSFYKRAIEQNETLAAGNLAGMYLDAGFADDAEKLVDQAKQQPDVDPKVGQIITNLAEAKEKEAKALEQHLKAAREKQRFFLSFAQAYFVAVPEHQDFDGVWTYPDGKLVKISHEGDSITAVWGEESLEQRFVGKMHNRAAKIKYDFPSMPDFDPKYNGYIYLSPDGSELHIYKIAVYEHSFEVLRRS